jgi:hypothetical protein
MGGHRFLFNRLLEQRMVSDRGDFSDILGGFHKLCSIVGRTYYPGSVQKALFAANGARLCTSTTTAQA